MKSYTPDDVIRVRSHLIEVATKRATIAYTELATKMGFDWDHRRSEDRRVIGKLLGEVSQQEYERGRPMLTAVVVRKGPEKLPGPGFWGFLGFPETPEFCKTERRRVHDFWEWKEPKKAP